MAATLPAVPVSAGASSMPLGAPARALSILVPSVHTRRATSAPRIAEELFGQWEALATADRDRVEILILADTKSMVLGDKRNAMVGLASGEYVAFVDDDDRLEPDYLAALLGAIDDHHPDVVTFTVSVSLDGGRPKRCRYSIAYRADRTSATGYERLPNHLCAVRRELAQAAGFPPIGRGEDSEYARRLRPLLTSEHVIDRILYHYDYSTAGTETQRSDPAPPRPAGPPVVDVVMLSRAIDDRLRAMCQHAVDSCIAGSRQPVNVLVVEQVPGVEYSGATTITEPGDFAYNAFVNRAAATGSAPWILVANSDLEFGEDWLAPLLAAGSPVVSPVSPGNPRQAGFTAPAVGRENGTHFSGWCFMIARDLWARIGGLDEDFRFWCADDAVLA